MKKLLVILALITFTFACEKPMPFDGVKYILNSDVIKSSFAFQFINAKTKEPIGRKNNQKVLVRIYGPNKDAVLSITGFYKSVYQSDKGFLSLGLNPSFVPSESNPLDITLVFEAAGYLSNSMRILVTNNQNAIHVVPMVELNNPPDGVSTITTHTSLLQSGETTADILVQSPIVAYSNTKASLRIEKGTIIKDSKGEKLTAPLKIMLSYFNNLSEGALSSHPGGGLISRVDSAGKKYEGAFNTAGYVTCEITDAKGRKANSFSKSITYTVEVSPLTISSETSQEIKSGEKIGVWSYNQALSQWKYEKSVAFQGPISNGNFELVTKVSKILPYNWDWFDGNCICNKGVDLNFNYPGTTGNYNVEIKAYNTVSNQLIRVYQVVTKNGESVNLKGASHCKGVNLLAYNSCDQLLGVITANDFCNSTYKFDLAAPLGNKTVSLKLSGNCSGSQTPIELRASAPVWYYDATCKDKWKGIGSLMNSELDISNLETGKTYMLGTYFDNKWIEFPLTADSDKEFSKQIMLSDELCGLLAD